MGTHAENHADKAGKGRADKKLSVKEREDIRSLYDIMTAKELADEYNVTVFTIYSIVK